MRLLARLFVAYAVAACGGASEARRGSGEVVTVAPVAATPIATKEEPKPTPSPPASDDVDDVLPFIRTVAPNERVLTRRGRELLFERQASLMQKCRVVPDVENGLVIGMRMFGVRPDGVLGRLGFENGDRLVSINGQAVGDPVQALEIYASLREVDRIDIDLVRHGSPLSLVVRIE